MKEFVYPNSGYRRATMTVKELREKLAEYPDDLPVFAEWESCNGYVTPDAFDIVKVRKGVPLTEFDALVIDVNDY